MTEPKKISDKPGSNYQEEHPKDSEPTDHKTVKKPEDKVYTKDEPHYKNPAKQRENDEQPVHSIKDPPKED
ncbi:hypothetical protein ABIB40_000044 [Pedobacter sp. UYP30]|uniref:hypothetical protein n=1 Tax=Pedobacter sp. UYP30 TaxID=1756400 RepID=UPI0033983F1B